MFLLIHLTPPPSLRSPQKQSIFSPVYLTKKTKKNLTFIHRFLNVVLWSEKLQYLVSKKLKGGTSFPFLLIHLRAYSKDHMEFNP